MSRAPRTNEFEERDYYPNPRRSAPELEDFEYRRPHVDLRVREREADRTPAFLREDARRSEAGPMVLRKRDVETFDRRVRSPSPVRVREERIVRRPRSVSPVRYHDHDHDHEHEHERSRTRVIERERLREPSVVRRRSPSPQVVRYVQRRERSPSPVEHEHIRTRIVQRERERVPSSPSSSPSPPPAPAPPQVIRGPTIEREVITHYRDIDHGVVKARPPSPPPAPRARPRERETDIDISLSKHRTEVDIRRSTTRARSRSRSRERRSHFHDDQLIIRDTDRLRIDDRGSRRRAHSAAPLGSPGDEEAEYITSKIDSRGRMGEAWGGATKDWTIVDVPPGTERVRMDGVGGASTDTTWSKYSGVRRTQFIPERDGALVPRAPSPAPPRPHRDSLSVTVYDREKEIDIEKTIDRKITRTPLTPAPPKEMWTEITKDLVLREAIEELGYRYEETKWFFYIMDYLRYEEVLQLTELTDRMRRARKDQVREIEWEREYREDWERRRHRHHHHHHDRRPSLKWDDERVREREIIYDSRDPGGRVYYR